MFYIILAKWCTGGKYQTIDGKCYFFEDNKMSFQSAKENCQRIYKGQRGKLVEPRTLETAQKLMEAAKKTFSIEDRNFAAVYFGVEIIDYDGNLKYTSTGIKTPYSPWNAEGLKRNDPEEPKKYLTVLPGNPPGLTGGAENGYWQITPGEYPYASICEF